MECTAADLCQKTTLKGSEKKNSLGVSWARKH